MIIVGKVYMAASALLGVCYISVEGHHHYSGYHHPLLHQWMDFFLQKEKELCNGMDGKRRRRKKIDKKKRKNNFSITSFMNRTHFESFHCCLMFFFPSTIVNSIQKKKFLFFLKKNLELCFHLSVFVFCSNFHS